MLVIRCPIRHCKFDASESQWAFFKNEWEIYKLRSGVTGSEATLELRAACTPQLQRALFDFLGQDTLAAVDESSLLTHIQQVAGKGKNTAVHRQEFYSMMQSPDEPIQTFVGKLRAKAAHCHFRTTCSNTSCKADISYSDSMVTDQMIVGLYDKDCHCDSDASRSISGRSGFFTEVRGGCAAGALVAGALLWSMPWRFSTTTATEVSTSSVSNVQSWMGHLMTGMVACGGQMRFWSDWGMHGRKSTYYRPPRAARRCLWWRAIREFNSLSPTLIPALIYWM